MLALFQDITTHQDWTKQKSQGTGFSGSAGAAGFSLHSLGRCPMESRLLSRSSSNAASQYLSTQRTPPPPFISLAEGSFKNLQQTTHTATHLFFGLLSQPRYGLSTRHHVISTGRTHVFCGVFLQRDFEDVWSDMDMTPLRNLSQFQLQNTSKRIP